MLTLMFATEICLNEILNEIKSDQGEKLKLSFLQSVQTGLSWRCVFELDPVLLSASLCLNVVR